MHSPPSPFGIFETILAIRGHCLLEAHHVERLVTGADCMGLPSPSPIQVSEFVREAAALIAHLDEGVVRCNWYTDSVDPRDASRWKLEASSGRLPAGVTSRRESGRVILLDRSFVRSMPHFKMIGEPSRTLSTHAILRRGVDEGLYVDATGSILEGVSTNVFAAEGSTLKTPPVSAGLLPGILRTWVVEHAEAAGYDIEETPIRGEDLLRGSFLTSSLTPIAEIREVNGSASARLDPRFHRLVELFLTRTGDSLSRSGEHEHRKGN